MTVIAKDQIYAYLDNIPEKEIKLMDNNQLYTAFPKVNKATVRRHKANYLNGIRRDHVITTVNKHTSPPSTPAPPPDLGGVSLTEEMIENAIVQALHTDPTIQTINAGINWLDKKKAISTDEGENNQSEIFKKYYNEALRNVYK